jgi:hypothetical protein
MGDPAVLQAATSNSNSKMWNGHLDNTHLSAVDLCTCPLKGSCRYRRLLEEGSVEGAAAPVPT